MPPKNANRRTPVVKVPVLGQTTPIQPPPSRPYSVPQTPEASLAAYYPRPTNPSSSNTSGAMSPDAWPGFQRLPRNAAIGFYPGHPQYAPAIPRRAPAAVPTAAPITAPAPAPAPARVPASTQQPATLQGLPGLRTHPVAQLVEENEALNQPRVVDHSRIDAWRRQVQVQPLEWAAARAADASVVRWNANGPSLEGVQGSEGRFNTANYGNLGHGELANNGQNNPTKLNAQNEMAAGVEDNSQVVNEVELSSPAMRTRSRMLTQQAPLQRSLAPQPETKDKAMETAGPKTPHGKGRQKTEQQQVQNTTPTRMPPPRAVRRTHTEQMDAAAMPPLMSSAPRQAPNASGTAPTAVARGGQGRTRRSRACAACRRSKRRCTHDVEDKGNGGNDEGR